MDTKSICTALRDFVWDSIHCARYKSPLANGVYGYLVEADVRGFDYGYICNIPLFINYHDIINTAFYACPLEYEWICWHNSNSWHR